MHKNHKEKETSVKKVLEVENLLTDVIEPAPVSM